jgi:hypothetical protein
METFKDSSTITVDINGENEKPNCKEGDEGCNAPDTFEFIIYNTGKISVNGDIAKEYLQNSRKITK